MHAGSGSLDTLLSFTTSCRGGVGILACKCTGLEAYSTALARIEYPRDDRDDELAAGCVRRILAWQIVGVGRATGNVKIYWNEK
jgi:hypothetical protein